MTNSPDFDFDVHAAALRARGDEIVLTARPKSAWRLDRFQLSRLAIEFRGEGGATIVTGVSPEDSVTFAVLAALDASRQLVNGHQLHPFDLVVLPRAQRFIQTSTGPYHWISLIVPCVDLYFADEAVQAALNGLSEVPRPVVLKSPTLAKKIVTTASAIEQIMQGETTPRSRVHLDEIEHSLIDTLAIAALAAVERASLAAGPRGPRRCSSYELAHGAVGLLRAPNAVRYHIADFCQALGATERQLRRSFNSFFAMGPTKLGRLQQVNRVRRMLVEGAAENTKILKILSICDVTEPGRFAGEYKALFGETPSRTRKRHLGDQTHHGLQ